MVKKLIVLLKNNYLSDCSSEHLLCKVGVVSRNKRMSHP